MTIIAPFHNDERNFSQGVGDADPSHGHRPAGTNGEDDQGNNPINKYWHYAVDFGAGGSTNFEALAMYRGEVVYVLDNYLSPGKDEDYNLGNFITVRFFDRQFGQDFYLTSAHAPNGSFENKFEVGDIVQQGQFLHFAGKTGNDSYKYHIHMQWGTSLMDGSDPNVSGDVDWNNRIADSRQNAGGEQILVDVGSDAAGSDVFVDGYFTDEHFGTYNGHKVYAIETSKARGLEGVHTAGVVIEGGGGNDTIEGSEQNGEFAGRDYLSGRGGDDWLFGRSGDDTYIFDAHSNEGNDVIFDSAGEHDTIRIYNIESYYEIGVQVKGSDLIVHVPNGDTYNTHTISNSAQATNLIEWLEAYDPSGTKLDSDLISETISFSHGSIKLDHVWNTLNLAMFQHYPINYVYSVGKLAEIGIGSGLPVGGSGEFGDLSLDGTSNGGGNTTSPPNEIPTTGGWVGFWDSAIAVEEGDGTTYVNAHFEWSGDVPNGTRVEWRLTPYGDHPADRADLYIGGDFPYTGTSIIEERMVASNRNKVRIPISGDEIEEFDEQVLVEITSVDNGARILPAASSVVLTIINDDAATVAPEDTSLPPSIDPYAVDLGEPSPRRLRIADGWANEDEGVGSVNLLTDGLQGALSDPITVVWEVVNGTATSGQDFVLPQYGVTVMERSRTPIEFQLIDDDVYEGSETFQINILRSNAIIEEASGTITISDDESPPDVDPGTTQPPPEVEEPTSAAVTEGSDTIDVTSGDSIAALGGDDVINVPSYDVLQSTTIDGGSGRDTVALTSSGAAIQLCSLPLQNIEVLQILGANTITMAASDIGRISGASTLMIVDAWDDPITFDLEGQSYTETSDSWSTTYTVGDVSLITNDSTPMTFVNGAGGTSPPPSATRQFEGTLNVTVAELDDGAIEGTGGWDELIVSGNDAVDLDPLDLIGVEVITFDGTGNVSVSWSTLIDHSTSMLLGVWDNQVLLDMEGRSFTDDRAVDGWSRVIESGGRELIMNDSVLLSFAGEGPATTDLAPVYGTSGNDTHTLGAGEHYFGGDGNDTVTTTLDVLQDAAVDGGGWWDGVKVEEVNNSVVDFSVLSLDNIEFLEVHGGGNEVQISASEILDVTENGELMLTHLYDDTLRIDAEGQEVAVEAGPGGWEQVVHVGTATITTESTTTLVIENEAVA